MIQWLEMVCRLYISFPAIRSLSFGSVLDGLIVVHVEPTVPVSH
jgi:hypothetical protein